ncbi:hypothetical protein [Micromonospora sp. DT233]|uniref:hypothetical protein n=1 Tax=Micromonospora sp. DT233 TaxID=3393432 RepID=UPI003CF5B82B
MRLALAVPGLGGGHGAPRFVDLVEQRREPGDLRAGRGRDQQWRQRGASRTSAISMAQEA